jgi:hypothetical protein
MLVSQSLGRIGMAWAVRVRHSLCCDGCFHWLELLFVQIRARVVSTPRGSMLPLVKKVAPLVDI